MFLHYLYIWMDTFKRRKISLECQLIVWFVSLWEDENYFKITSALSAYSELYFIYVCLRLLSFFLSFPNFRNLFVWEFVQLQIVSMKKVRKRSKEMKYDRLFHENSCFPTNKLEIEDFKKLIDLLSVENA